MSGRWLDLPIARKSVLVAAGPLLVLFVALLLIYQLERQTAAAEREVQDTLAILSDLHEAHSLLAETAAGVRGFLLVEQEAFLDPYLDAEPRLLGVAERLVERAAHGARAERYRAMLPLFARKLDGWKQLLDEAEAQDSALRTRRLVEGKQVLDQLRLALRQLAEEEKADLQERSERASGLRQRNLLVTMVAALTGGLGALGAIAVFAAGLATRLRALARDADRVGSGQSPLGRAPSADEIGQVGRRLGEASALLQARAEQLHAARSAAEAADRAKTEFLSRMSHELRTPLNAILGYAQVLGDTAEAERPQRFAGHIETAGRHLLGLISEMLDVARIEADGLARAPERVPLGAAIDEALALVRPQAERAGLRIDWAGVAPALAVRGDRQRLRQVLLNLLSNAIKFNRVSGRIGIAARQEDGRVRISVRDDGVGLSVEQRARLFQPFERIRETAEGIEGTGLGLALSKRLVEAMEGRIGVESEPGRGSCFWFELAAGTVAPVAADAARSAAATAGPQRRVLYVEDNASNRALVATVLERRPHWQLRFAGSWAEADEALAQEPVDLLLLDLRLPDGDGGDWLRRRCADGATLPPVVVVSADATAPSIERLRAAGASAYLTKPLDLRALLTELDRWLQ